MTKKLTLFAVVASLFSVHLFAQAPPTYSSADIEWQLQKLQVLGSVLYVGAHPDDENTRLLTYLSKEKKYRTAYLSLTRGDGGQNLIGDEQGVSLGLIRTQELLAARRIDGAEQFFSRAYDFGFSKNPEETFKIWDKEKILSDVVWVIRYFKPDVIITRFPEDSRAGHGHHSASAILAREAFYAAADPKRFPEQLQSGLTVWQPQRLLWNRFNFGAANPSLDSLFKIDAGDYNALLGKSNGEIAAASRSQHKTQGFGSAASRGAAYEYFSIVAGAEPAKELMDGIDISWKRTGDERPAKMIGDIISQYTVSQPEKSLPQLADLLHYLSSLPKGSPWVEQKIREVNKVMLAAMGVYFEATTRQQFAAVGDTLPVSFTVVNRSHYPLKEVVIRHGYRHLDINEELRYNSPKTINDTLLINSNSVDGQPYWLQEPMAAGSFTIPSQKLLAFPDNPKNEVSVTYVVGDSTKLTAEYGIQYKYTDPAKGEIYEPVINVPPLIVSAFPAVVLTNVVPKVNSRVVIHYETRGRTNLGNATLAFDGLQKMKQYPIDLKRQRSGEVVFDPDTLVNTHADMELSPRITVSTGSGMSTYGNNIRLIKYEHIPVVHYVYRSKVKLVGEEIKVMGKRIGYIKGAGDQVPEALETMGYEVTVLDESDITMSRLAGFDAVITGVRAYNVHPFMADKHAVLMDYVQNGGNLIVQYNTSNFGGEAPPIGPYAFTITNKRVTDEKAKVNFLLPQHPVLNYPNRITEKDFDGWIQERGIYFAENADKAFEMPLSMGDPGEEEQKGSLIIASYGKGNFVYTGLVFFRELPAGVPGAYRLLANIIALNKKKGF